jgi:hypothetical protein
MHGISTRPLTGLTVVGITVAALFTGVTGVRTRHRLRENGAPIWAVISLTLAGDTMDIAQMLERSQTSKRGTGKKSG